MFYLIRQPTRSRISAFSVVRNIRKAIGKIITKNNKIRRFLVGTQNNHNLRMDLTSKIEMQIIGVPFCCFCETDNLLRF